MKKNFLIGALVISASLLGVLTLNAANNRIEIVSENDSVKTLSSDGASILNTINTATSDLVNGEVNIEIILNNSKNTEVMYAIDNSAAVSSIKNNIIDSIKTNANTISKMDNLKQGVAYTTKNGSESAISIVELDNTGIETALENVKTATAGNEGAIFDAIDNAAEKFSASNVDNKVLVVFVGSLGTLSADQVTALKTKMEGLKTKGIKVIAYGINLGTANTNFNTIFADGIKYEVASANVSTGLNFTTDLASFLPSAKQNVKGNISFDSYILNNFEIKNINSTVGTASYDNATNKIVWEPENIGINQVEKLTYTLSLKSVVDDSIVDKLNLRTNRQIKISGTGNGVTFDDSYPKDSTVDDEICSPTIRILKEAIDNPKTGIENYLIAGICMIAVGSITLLVLNRKTKFSRI